MAEVLSDFQSIQYYIAAAPVDPSNMDDYYTEGWATLRQCNLDGQRILNCGADTAVPEASGPEEQARAELKQSVLFSSSLEMRKQQEGTDVANPSDGPGSFSTPTLDATRLRKSTFGRLLRSAGSSTARRCSMARGRVPRRSHS